MTAKRRKFKNGQLVKLTRVDTTYSNYVPALDSLVGKYFQIQTVFTTGEVSIGSWHVPVEWLEPAEVWQLIVDHNALAQPQPSPSAGEVLTQVSQVLKEVQRLDAAQARLADESRQQAKEQREWARQMEQWNAGKLAERPRRPTIHQPVVVDYGDVWAQLSRLAPIVERALVAPQPMPERDSREEWLAALATVPNRTPADVTDADLRKLAFNVQDLRDFAEKQKALSAPADAESQ